MSWLQTNETDIIQRLESVITAVPVTALPEKNFKFVHPKGTVLVMFTGMAPGRTIAPGVQEVSLKYEVLILSRSLRDHTGLYPLISSALTSLLGWKPSNGSALTLDKANPTGLEESAWGFSMTFSTDSVLVPCLDPAPEYPIIKNSSVSNCGKDCESCQ